MKKLLFLLFLLIALKTNAQCWNLVATGFGHTAAIKNNGTLWTWGSNNQGQLGDNSSTNRLTPIQIGTDTDWQFIVAGLHHTLALKADGSLWAWGTNTNGELGDGTNISRSAPTRIGNEYNWVKISTGNDHNLALKNDGTLWAWGSNQNGCLGDGTIINRNVPIQIGLLNDWQSISAGGYFSTAINTDRALWSWGLNSDGQLGIGTQVYENRNPTRIGLDNDWQNVYSGYYYSFAIKSNGTLWGWGWNIAGSMGNGSNGSAGSSVPAPIQIGNQTNWQSITVGDQYALGIKTNGTLWGWGDNSLGQLGDGTTISKNITTQIGTDTNWRNVSAKQWSTV